MAIQNKLLRAVFPGRRGKQYGDKQASLFTILNSLVHVALSRGANHLNLGLLV